MIAFSAALFLMAASAADDGNDRYYRGEDIQLTCYGGAQKTTVETHSGYEWDRDKHKYEPTTTLENGKSNFDTAITVAIEGDRGSINLPKSLVPPINSGSNNGWWDIDNLNVSHDEIRGQFKLNGMNQPRLVINRRSGVMTIDGMIKFSGRCEVDDGHRKF
jgi:hypothetical protein